MPAKTIKPSIINKAPEDSLKDKSLNRSRKLKLRSPCLNFLRPFLTNIKPDKHPVTIIKTRITYTNALLDNIFNNYSSLSKVRKLIN